MNLVEILDKVYSAQNEQELFDSICYLQDFVEQNDRKEFFEERVSKEGVKFLILKNDYTIGYIKNIFKNPYFINSVSNILKYQRDYKEIESVPSQILKDGYFVNLFLNCCFYFISSFSSNLKQAGIDYIGSYFRAAIKKIEKTLSYEFSKIDILNAFENLIFDRQYFFQKEFPININADDFYYNFKKSRLIIGNYLVDFSVPILLSNSFKKVVSAKKESGGKLSARYAFNVLDSVLKKYEFLSGGFRFSDLDAEDKKEISSFEHYFSTRESKKILFLVNSVVGDLNNFDESEILRKIDNSESDLNTVKEFFYKNYNIFPDYNGPRTAGQWGNKSFLNTIKLFSVLDTTKKSTNIQWKIDVFLKHLGDWIDDLYNNINYFLKLDDYNEIRNVIKMGETNLIEFKSTFGLPFEYFEDFINEDVF